MAGDLHLSPWPSVNASLGAMLLSLSVLGLASLTFYDEWDSHIPTRTRLEVPAIHRLDIIDGFARSLSCNRRSAHCSGVHQSTS